MGIREGQNPLQASRPSGPVLFEEVQRFDQWWARGPFYLVMALFLGVITLISYAQVYQGAPPLPASALAALVAGIIVAVGLPALFLNMKLVIRLDRQNLTADFWPFRRKVFPLAEILAWEARTYRPLRDFGGWGMRHSRSLGCSAYNVKGDQGVFFELAGGRKFMLGSQRAEELAAAIASAKGNSYS